MRINYNHSTPYIDLTVAIEHLLRPKFYQENPILINGHRSLNLIHQYYKHHTNLLQRGNLK